MNDGAADDSAVNDFPTTDATRTGIDLVQVWLLRDDPPDAEVAVLAGVLDAEERRRAAAFSREESRRRFIVAHGATRFIVGERLGAPPHELRWEHGSQGKPELVGAWTGVRVNLSHSGGMIMVAVSAERGVGVDVQQLLPGAQAGQLAQRYFPRDELEHVSRSRDADELAERFAESWSRKEALTKAAGGRLTQTLPVSVLGRAVIAGPLGVFRVADLTAPDGFRGAVALSGDGEFEVEQRWWKSPPPTEAADPAAAAAEATEATESADPYCLQAGEAASLLAGHPWRRFVAIGDSIAEGVGDLLPGYSPLPFADRVAAELALEAPDWAYLNLGRRNLRAHEVRAGQLAEALAFQPDLAFVVCGANDALRPGYQARADAVDRDLAAMVTALQEHGALVITVSIFVRPRYPSLPSWLTPPPAERMTMLGRRTAAMASGLGTVHVDLANHPIAGDTASVSADGLHGNGRAQAVAAAATVRLLGARLHTAPTAGTAAAPACAAATAPTPAVAPAPATAPATSRSR